MLDLGNYFDDIPNDIVDLLFMTVDMHTLAKVSCINEKYNKYCANNRYWKPHYNKLFDRRIIGPKSIHKGEITWYCCRVGNFPGWNNIHQPILLGQCNNKEHYVHLENKELKREFKNYKKQTIKKYCNFFNKKKNKIWNNKMKKLIEHYEISIKEYNEQLIKLKRKERKSQILFKIFS